MHFHEDASATTDFWEKFFIFEYFIHNAVFRNKTDKTLKRMPSGAVEMEQSDTFASIKTSFLIH
ncbi:hypothetical protein FQN60_005735, partial [Etheostoma spectabile]